MAKASVYLGTNLLLLKRESTLPQARLSFSKRLEQVASRYAKITKSILPSFTENEWQLIKAAIGNSPLSPVAPMVINAMDIEQLDAEWEIDKEAFLSRLNGLTPAQDIAVFEIIEQWNAKGCSANEIIPKGRVVQNRQNDVREK